MSQFGSSLFPSEYDATVMERMKFLLDGELPVVGIAPATLREEPSPLRVAVNGSGRIGRLNTHMSGSSSSLDTTMLFSAADLIEIEDLAGSLSYQHAFGECDFVGQVDATMSRYQAVPDLYDWDAAALYALTAPVDACTGTAMVLTMADIFSRYDAIAPLIARTCGHVLRPLFPQATVEDASQYAWERIVRYYAAVASGKKEAARGLGLIVYVSRLAALTIASREWRYWERLVPDDVSACEIRGILPHSRPGQEQVEDADYLQQMYAHVVARLRPDSLGIVVLDLLLSDHRPSEIAKQLGVSKSAISYWRTMIRALASEFRGDGDGDDDGGGGGKASRKGANDRSGTARKAGVRRRSGTKRSGMAKVVDELLARLDRTEDLGEVPKRVDKMSHKPVNVGSLVLISDGRIVDCTLGGGGHSESLLSGTNGKTLFLALDKDEDTLALAEERVLGLEADLVYSAPPPSAYFFDQIDTIGHVDHGETTGETVARRLAKAILSVGLDRTGTVGGEGNLSSFYELPAAGRVITERGPALRPVVGRDEVAGSNAFCRSIVVDRELPAGFPVTNRRKEFEKQQPSVHNRWLAGSMQATGRRFPYGVGLPFGEQPTINQLVKITREWLQSSKLRVAGLSYADQLRCIDDASDERPFRIDCRLGQERSMERRSVMRYPPWYERDGD
jgi:MraW methylase family